jgi:NAD(P)-dependent dehydrogenase (short-subunit alcohol dehydrogenase family)
VLAGRAIWQISTPFPSFHLDGKVALIARASKGLGRAMALSFAKSGAHVVVASRKVDACEARAAEISLLGCRLPAVGGVSASTGDGLENRDSLQSLHATGPYTGRRPRRLNM